MASAGEYEEDARRIKSDYTDPDDVEEGDLRDALEDADFAQSSIDDVLSWIPNAEEVREAVGEPHADGITTREDVEAAVDSVDGVGYDDGSHDALTDAVASEVGAPTEQEARRVQIEATTGDVRTPEDGRSTSASVVRNTHGDAVGVVGPKGWGSEVAETEGVEYLGGPNQLAETMSVKPAPGGREGLAYVRGEPVGEVDL